MTPTWLREKQDWSLFNRSCQPGPSRREAEVAFAGRPQRLRPPARAAEAEAEEAEESRTDDPPPTPLQPQKPALAARGSAATTTRVRSAAGPGRPQAPARQLSEQTSRPSSSRGVAETEAEDDSVVVIGNGVWQETVRSRRSPAETTRSPSPGSPDPSLSGRGRSRSRGRPRPEFRIGQTVQFDWASWYLDDEPPARVSNQRRDAQRPHRCGEPALGSANCNPKPYILNYASCHIIASRQTLTDSRMLESQI